MAMIYYTVAGIVLYLAADGLLRWLEARAGRRFENRTLIFFAFLLSMAVSSFAVIRALLEP